MANEKSQSVDPDSFDTLLRLYGDPLLRYLLNVEPGDSLKETVQASPTRSQAAVTLLPSEALPQMLDWERDSYVENLLGFNSADQHHNRANACRIACGGELPSLGAIERSIHLRRPSGGSRAIACYPAVLFPQHETVRWPVGAQVRVLLAGPLLDVVRAVLVDPDVGRLFPDALSGGVPKDVEELVNISCMVQWSSGDGGTLQPLGMVSSMMEAVLIRHVMTGSSSLVSSVSR